MTLARSAGRSLSALVLGSLAVSGGIASCSGAEPTLAPDAGGAAGAPIGKAGTGGSAGTASVAGGSGGSTAGASSTGGTGTGGTVAAGAGGSLSTGGTGTAGGNSGGMGSGGMSTGGSAGAGGSAGSVGTTGGSAGTGGSSSCTDDPPPTNGTCADAVSFGWCGQSWMNGACARTCGTCTGGTGGTSSVGGAGGMSAGGSSGSGAGGGGGSGNTGNVAPPPDIQGGSNAWGSRYWDCCKPACGWTGNTGGRTPVKSCDKSNNQLGDNDARNACENGGSAFMCWKDTPWQVGEKLSYGFAAASGPNYQCGRCFHIQFDGGSHNGGMGSRTEGLKGKHMIVQVINNGGVAQDQFDLLIPGGGVGALNACTNQWGTSDLGATYGGFLAGCNGDVNCVKDKCATVFAGKPDLQEGCDWFLGWFGAADNPTFTYKQIACPAELAAQSGLSDG